MEVHSVAAQTIQAQIDQIKKGHVKTVPTRPFEDPIREFSRASNAVGTVRNWLTMSISDRKRFVRDSAPCIKWQASDDYPGETDSAFEGRKLERWRALCVIIQEESRPGGTNQSVEVAIGAIKQLFPDHEWGKATPPPIPK